ncbi:MAG: release factor glutamine methyltransferase [Candidatus Hydrogenedentota bacterium]
MVTVRDRIDEAVRLLADVSDTPRADAEILMAHAAGVPRRRLPQFYGETFDFPLFQVYLERRLAYEPIPYIIGEWEFYSIPLHVRPPALVPRPETEHLVETVLEFVGDQSARVLDIGTGSGCVAVAIAVNAPATEITATDINPMAVELARENAVLNGVADRISVLQSDLFQALSPGRPLYDVICSNPPYVEEDAFSCLSPTIRLYEDPNALIAGVDGLDVIRRLIAEAPPFLVPGGLLAFEIGLGQDGLVRILLEEAKFDDIRVKPDLAGISRIVSARNPSP